MINVRIDAPRYVQGMYKFKTLEQFYDLLVLIKSVGNRNLSSYIFVLAKDGTLNLSKYGFSIDARLDCSDYALANKLARDVGLIDTRKSFKPSKEKILAFAKAFDSAKSQL